MQNVEIIHHPRIQPFFSLFTSETKKWRDLGYSLIECSISIALVSILLCALIQQYMQIKQHHDLMYATLDEMIEAQYALDFIRERIQQSGFTPCRALHDLHQVDHRRVKDDMTSLTIFPQGIVCRRMGEPFALAYAHRYSRQIKLKQPIKVTPGEQVLISDCEHAELHVVIEVKYIGSDMIVELQNPLTFDYASSFYFAPWVEERFWIKHNESGKNVLFYRAKHAETLTANIQNMLVTRDKDNVRVLFELPHHGSLVLQTRLRMP